MDKEEVMVGEVLQLGGGRTGKESRGKGALPAEGAVLGIDTRWHRCSLIHGEPCWSWCSQSFWEVPWEIGR